MGTQMLAVTDVIKLHYTTITPQLLLNGTGHTTDTTPIFITFLIFVNKNFEV